MRRTEEPPASAGQVDLFSRLAELASLAAAVIAFAAALSSDAQLRHLIAVALGASLALLGGAVLARANCRYKRGKERDTPREGYGRLCFALGLLQFVVAMAWPSVASFTGVPVAGALIWLGLKGSVGQSRRSTGEPRRPRLGRLAVITLSCVLVAYVGLAGAVIGNHGNHQPRKKRSGKLKEALNPPKGGSPSGGAEELPSYADLCPALPDPLVIGHGLGELFRRDGAIKAGCGTRAFQVPETGTWVAAGMCFGERRSVAVSSLNHSPVIVYGESAEFIWNAAQEGELTAVEAAAPQGGDVILVETRAGTYGFARATRSATPGNEDARQCNEVGGTAEPFAQMAPPLVWLWIELIHEQATWFWPAADRTGETESVAFLSAEGVASGTCVTDVACILEFEGKEQSLESITFSKLENLREYMPPEELPATS